MFNFLKKYWLFILLAFLATIVVLAWLFTRGEKERKVIVAPPPTPSSRFSEPAEGNFTINAALPVPPSSLEVYKVKTYAKENITSQLSEVFKTLKLNPQAQTRTTSSGALVWDEEQGSLLVRLPSGKLMFSGEVKVAPEFTASGARTFALEAISSWGYLVEFLPVETTGLVAFEGHLRQAKESEAEIFSVLLQPTFKNTPIVGAGTGNGLVEVMVTRNGKLTALTLDFYTPAEPLGTFEAITSQEAISLLQSGAAQTLWVRDEKGNPAASLEVEPLKNITISKSYLAYLDTGEEQELYQPVLVFEGKGEVDIGQERSIAVYIPLLR